MALILKRASVSRVSGEWSEDNVYVLADGIVVGRISAVGCGRWPTGPHENRTPIHGYEATCAAPMAAFAKSWLRGSARKAPSGAG